MLHVTYQALQSHLFHLKRIRSYSASSDNAVNKSGILDYAYYILTTSDPKQKATISQSAFQFIKATSECEGMSKINWLAEDKVPEVPEFPHRPSRPILVHPKDMPSHRTLNVMLSTYLLHGLAHIELNAIDTAWDTMLRFGSKSFSWGVLPQQFYHDFASIASDEARHFLMLCEKLESKGYQYGSFPAHSRIWDDAQSTANDFLGRLTVIQLVQEPRALDSWDRLVEKFNSQNEKECALLLDLICREEIDHVKKGMHWFKYICEKENVCPISTFHEKAELFVGLVPPPFNQEARAQAGMDPEWYLPISKKKPTPAL